MRKFLFEVDTTGEEHGAGATGTSWVHGAGALRALGHDAMAELCAM